MFLGTILGFFTHRNQPIFWVKFKEILTAQGAIKDKTKIVNAKLYTKEILTSERQKEFINKNEFINFFKLVSQTTYDNYQKNNNYFKDNFFLENILNEDQIIFETSNEKEVKNFEKYYLPLDYQNKNYELYKVKYYNIINLGVLHKSKRNSNKLIIYHQGHAGNSYDKKYFLNLKSKYLNDGYDILNLNMPLNGINSLTNKYINFPINPYKKILPSKSFSYPFKYTRQHEMFKFFYDKNFPQKKPLSIFLSGNYYLIKNILSLNNYDEIKIIGHSGGGLQAIYYMFLIPEIEKSYISSGFFTKTHRLDIVTGGDWEHHYSDFIMNNTYFDLIYGSLIDGNNRFSREIIFQFNNLDPSCCQAPYSNNFVKLINEMSEELNLNIKGIFVEKNFHQIDLDTLYKNF